MLTHTPRSQREIDMSASTTIKRAFTDFSKEEAWLNQMSHEGKALVGYRGGRYTFVDDEPGAWQYAIEVLGRAGREYLSFLEETGVETVAVYANRAYLRKRDDGTDFELHSDLESRLEQARRGSVPWIAIPVSQVGLAFILVLNAFVVDSEASNLARGIVLACATLLVFAAIVEYLVFGRPYRERVRQLERERSIRE